MKYPTDLERWQLEKIAAYAQGFLFFDVDEDARQYVDTEKEVNGADFVEHMGSVLQEMGLTPTLKDHDDEVCAKLWSDPPEE